MQPGQTTLKIVPLPVGEEYTTPEGWAVKDLISTPIGENNDATTMVFHAVLLKLPPKQDPIKPAKPSKIVGS